jgi:DNA invertase Pin-like site-specific DNA recombinase
MKPYFGYVRVSTPKQGQGVSLQEQRAAISAHASRNGLAIVEWFEEKETAAKEGRNVFTRMLAELESGKARGVVIHKIDRSARNLWDWANLGNLFDRGIDVQFAHDSIDLHSRGGRLSADIMAVVAADYVRNLRDEVKKGFYGRLKQGIYPLPAPVGYLDRGAGRPKAVDPDTAPHVRWAFERYSTGATSLDELTRDLRKRGLHTRRGRWIAVNTVSKMLRNPFYIGIIRIGTTNELFQGEHQPIVKKATFDRVQAVLEGRFARKVAKHDYIFRRFVRCASCDRHLTGERKKGRYVYYRCYKRECSGAVLREDAIDGELARVAALTVLAPREIGDLRDLALEELATGKDDTEQRQSELRLRIAKCDARIARLTDAFIEAMIDKDTYEERKRALLTDRRQLLDTLETPALTVPSAQRVLKYLELENVVEFGYGIAKPDKKREIGLALSWNFSAAGKEPVIALYSPYREIVEWRKSLSVDRVAEDLELRDTLTLYQKLKDAAANDNEPTEAKSLKS